jgi:hypothetical protein
MSCEAGFTDDPSNDQRADNPHAQASAIWSDISSALATCLSAHTTYPMTRG